MMNRTSNVSVNAPINAVIKKYIPDGINKDVPKNAPKTPEIRLTMTVGIELLVNQSDKLMPTIAPTISVRMILIKIPPVGYDLRPV
ncbi:hypothetical protein AAA451_12975 [Staphylococcus equorum]